MLWISKRGHCVPERHTLDEGQGDWRSHSLQPSIGLIHAVVDFTLPEKLLYGDAVLFCPPGAGEGGTLSST